MRRIARALHHRDRDRAVHDDVGDGAARDHAVEARGDDGHLGRAAAVAAHRRHREVGEELVAADRGERLAEEDVRDHDRRRDRERHAEDPVRVEIEVDGDALPARTLGVEHAGQEPGELRVEDAPHGDPHERPAGEPPDGLEDQHDREAAQQEPVPGEGAERIRDARVEDRHVAADHERPRTAEPVVPRHAREGRARRRPDDEEHGSEPEPEEEAEVLLVEEREREIVVDLGGPE